MMNGKSFVLLGPAGSGKSTQARLLVDRLHLTHVDMGGALRKVAGEDTAFGKALYEVINVRKELVPDGTIEKVLDHAFADIAAEQNVVLDGAPRRRSQVDEVERVLSRHGRSIDKVIFIHLPEEVSVERIASRFACAQCGKAFIIGTRERAMHDLKCSDCSGNLEQRKDDTPEGVRKRLAIFATDTLPVIEYYREQGKLLTVEGTGSVEEIFDDIKKEISA